MPGSDSDSPAEKQATPSPPPQPKKKPLRRPPPRRKPGVKSEAPASAFSFFNRAAQIYTPETGSSERKGKGEEEEEADKKQEGNWIDIDSGSDDSDPGGADARRRRTVRSTKNSYLARNRKRTASSEEDVDRLESMPTAPYDSSDDSSAERRPDRTKSRKLDRQRSSPPPPSSASPPRKERGPSPERGPRHPSATPQLPTSDTPHAAPSNTIEIDSGPDDDVVVTKATPAPATGIEPQGEDLHPDPYIRNLQLQAREEARRNQASSQASQRAQRLQGQQTATLSADEQGPVLSIFISSPIPGTKPLIIKRRHKQSLRRVLDAWKDQNASRFPEGISPGDVFLTWKRTIRVLGSSSCAAVGVKVDLGTGDLKDQDGLTDDRRIHFEAVTEKIMESRQSEGEFSDEEVPEEKTVKIVLKAAGKGEELRIAARMTTTFEELAEAFRVQRHIDGTKDVILRFDGDELDPSETVEDQGMEDMDAIDVVIK